MRSYTLLTEAKFNRPGEAPALVSLPHTWNALDGQDGGDDYFRGECCYEIPLPSPTAGKRQYIEFGGANHVAAVWCNGVFLGEHKGGFSTFRFELTDALKEKDNLLTVKVFNGVCDVYPQRADFTFFGGIYRKVYFVEVETAHFDLMKNGSSALFVTPYVSGLTRVDAFPVCADGCSVIIELFDGENSLVAKAEIPAEAQTFADLTVPTPHLWQGMEDPYLYSAKATLVKDGKALDEVCTHYGYRSYHVDPEKGFFLNGVSTPLHGVCRHQDRENMGWAISEKEHEEDIALIREIGANTVRLAHYQHDRYFYDLCDKEGFAIWAEIPYISSHLPGKDAFENTLSQMTELIAQNYNHPSILFWGISNEITIGGVCEEQHLNLRALHRLCKELDPGRPTTMAQLARVEYQSPHNNITDLVSYNNYYGWYTGTIEDNAAKMDEFHKTYPDKPYGISEYGVDHAVSWHSAKPFNHDYTEEYAVTYHHYMLKEFSKRPWLWATHVWNMFDFAVDQRSDGGNKGKNLKGLVTYDRKTKKDTFFVYKAYWTKEPMVHIAGRRFADRAPEERDLSVFTNGKKVELYLNGKKLCEKDAVDHLAHFERVPLADGKNEVRAVIDGAEDTVFLNGVKEHNLAYDLPDITAALQAGNWFTETDTEKDYGEDGYNSHDTIETLFESEDCMQIFKGWIMNLDEISLGEKLHVVGRLPQWQFSQVKLKTPYELNALKNKVSEESFLVLDKMLRGIRRK